MDPLDIIKKITSRTRAIVVQHTFGIPANMDQIMSIAQRNGIKVIEDCCHGLVSMYRGRTIGDFGVGSFYSFEWGKPIVIGIGGSAIINDVNLKQKLKSQHLEYRFPSIINQLRINLQYFAHSALYFPWLYWPVRSLYHFLGSIGAAESNYNPIQKDRIAEDFSLKMSTLLQNRLNNKLKNLNSVAQHSREVTIQYRNLIGSAAVSHPVLPTETETVFARYPLIAKDKKKLLGEARKANVELAEWYSTVIHPLKSEDMGKVYYDKGSCPQAELRCKQVVSLPTHLRVGERDIKRTVEFINRVK
jgi:dTDP-4-amino-4,6-dideoxygalactose transaminase